MPNKTKLCREAFKVHDIEKARLLHEESVEPHQSAGKHIGCVVYGGLDGIISIFSIVAGVTGAKLSVTVVLILGFANLVADAISMGFGEYLSNRATCDFQKAEYERELWEFDYCLDGEKREMIEIFQKKGIDLDDSQELVRLLAKYRTTFVDIMVVEELKLMPPDNEATPIKEGVITFLSFCCFGCVPLICYVIAILASGNNSTAGLDLTFGITCCITGATMFTLGAIASKFSTQKWWKSGLFMLGNGALAASVAYFIGELLSKLVVNV